MDPLTKNGLLNPSESGNKVKHIINAYKSEFPPSTYIGILQVQLLLPSTLVTVFKA